MRKGLTVSVNGVTFQSDTTAIAGFYPSDRRTLLAGRRSRNSVPRGFRALGGIHVHEQRLPTAAFLATCRVNSMVLVLGVLALTSALVSPVRAAAVEFKPGDRFPTIALPRIDDGQASSVVQFRGQRLMLHIFASW